MHVTSHNIVTMVLYSVNAIYHQFRVFIHIIHFWYICYLNS
uniref:Uncharacterized protein n=1 Tax=Amphimedon queenslandica TaxID=400682 RepID=A0A1X7UV66_AMPQE